MGIAPALEESLKLVPLLVLAVVAPGRVRRFALSDWAVLGFACGAGFNAAEDAARELLRSVRGPSLWDLLAALAGREGGLSCTWNPWASARFETADGVAVAAGHGVWTMFAATCLGLAVHVWRWPRPWSGGAAAAVGAGGMLLVISDHAGFKAWNKTAEFTDLEDSGFPAALATVWWVLGHGHLTAGLAFSSFCLALAIDVRRRALASHLIARDAVGRLQHPGVADRLWWVPDRTAEAWLAPFHRRVAREGIAVRFLAIVVSAMVHITRAMPRVEKILPGFVWKGCVTDSRMKTLSSSKSCLHSAS